MNWYFLWTCVSVCSIYCLKNTEQCSPPHGWSPLSPEKRAQKADIVLYGTVVSTPRVNQSSSEEGRFYGVVLQVHCTVKSDVKGSRIPHYVRISGFSNFSGGLCVHTKAFVNKPYIIFVKRNAYNNPKEFQVFEVNIQKGAVHPGHKMSVLREVMFSAGENASLPLGVKSDSKPGCPHFKRRFRDPTAHRFRQKNCRCKKKKHKHKKRKRIKPTSRLRKPSWSLNEVPTLPRTRRYSSVLTAFDDHVDAFDNPNSQSVDVFTLRSNSHRLNPDRYMYFLMMYWISMTLLPT